MKLLIRADASTRTGTGHVMRCLALAQAWREAGGTVSFAQAQSLPSLLARLEHEEIPVLPLEADPGSPADATQTIALAQQVGADWLVADSYHFGGDYQQRLKEAGLSLLIVDDYGHAEYYRADIILNQNISAHEEMYAKRNTATRLLLGPRYAMLRSEFWPWRGWQREVLPLARRVLVTMGGSDPDNVTHMVIQALHHLQEKNDVDAVDARVDATIEATVVVGGSNPHFEMLTSAARDMPSVQVVQNVNDMPQRMAWADVAIAAGGSTNWELAFMGLPTMTIILAENQSPIAEHLHRWGVVHNLGWYSELAPTTIAHALEALLPDAARRGEMARRGRELVGGGGGERRVVHSITEKAKL